MRWRPRILAPLLLDIHPTSGYDSNVLSLADFLAGCFTSPTNIVEGDPKRQVFENTWDIFGQDAWQINHQLNINYGIRYDYSGPIHSQYHDLTTFDPTAPNGLAVAGVNRPNIYQQYYGSISPRVGFAYQPAGTRTRSFVPDSVCSTMRPTWCPSSICAAR